MNRLTIIAVLAALLWGCVEADKRTRSWTDTGEPGTRSERRQSTEGSIPGDWGHSTGSISRWRYTLTRLRRLFLLMEGSTMTRNFAAWYPIMTTGSKEYPSLWWCTATRVNDPHINPVLCIDGQGYLWVFVSGRTKQPLGYKFRSRKPLNIDRFDLVSEEEFSYPQPWYVEGEGFIHLFGKNPGQWEVTFETSKDGLTWSEDTPIAAIRAEGDQRTGHYQISNQRKNLIGVMFQRHLNGNSNRRTDLYYMQTTDMGKTWQAADGQTLQIPVTRPDAPCRVADYAQRGRNVYLKDLNYDSEGNPVLVYLTSGGSEPEPESGPCRPDDGPVGRE